MKKSIICFLFFWFCFASISFADTSIKAEVDKKKLSTDETLTYKLTITSSEKQLPQPQIVKFEGFNIISQVESSAISFLKSQITTNAVYVYILAPTDVGKFKIGPSLIKIKNKTYSSAEFNIEVVAGKVIPKPESEQPQYTL